MAARLAFTVTNHSLTFFIKGRPYSLTKDHENYAQARAHLQTAPDVDHDPELLVELVDARRALHRASFGRIQFDGNEILWQGKPLHGIWVDRILEFRAAGEDHTALFNALDRLVHNPTAAAIQRLPIFLDRVALPFMPDGRFLAFKGVRSDFCSDHASPDGSRFRHLVGDKPRMPREQVDANPNNTCSTGLHVGAPGYVRGHYSGGTYALVLVAVDPVDVVSVPTDYNGEKMRVCGYEVIEHLDQDYSDELFGRLRSTYIEPKPAVEPAPTGAELAALAVVGDTVTYAGHDSDGHSGAVRAGLYEVLQIDDEIQDGKRLRVATAWDQVWLHDDKVTKVERDGLVLRPTSDDEGVEEEEEIEEDFEEETEFDRVKLDDVIEYEDQYGATNFGLVVTATEHTVEVRDFDGELYEVDVDAFTRNVPASEITASMLVTKGTLVQIERHDFLQDGAYTIAGIEEENGDGDQVEPDSEMWSVLVEGRRLPVRNRNIVVANHKGEHLWPRTKVETDGDTTTLTSLDGHDLREDTGILPVPHAEAVLTVALHTASEALVEEPEVILAGDFVEVTGEGWPPAGVYPVIAVDRDAQIQTEHDGVQTAPAHRVKLHQSRPWMRAEIGGEVEVGPATVWSSVASGRYRVNELRLSDGTPGMIVDLGPQLVPGWVDATRVTAAYPKA